MTAARKFQTSPETHTVEGIAAMYAQELGGRAGREIQVRDYHLHFAEAILARDAYALNFLANGLNNVGKAVFTAVTGVQLPRTQSGTWATILEWAGVDPKQDDLKKAEHHLQVLHTSLCSRFSEVDRLTRFAASGYAQGFVQVIKDGRRYLMADASGKVGLNLSARGLHGEHTRPYIEAYLAVQKIKVELGLQKEPVYVPADTPADNHSPAPKPTPATQLTEQLGMGF